MTEQSHTREHIWRIQEGNYPGNFEIMCICNSRCAYIPTEDDAIKFTTMLNEYETLKAATERLEETNKGLFNIIKTYHPAYLDGCECPQCGDMPIYFEDVAYANILEGKP